MTGLPQTFQPPLFPLDDDFRLPDGRLKYDSKTWDLLGPRSKARMETEGEFRWREAMDQRSNIIFAKLHPELVKQQRAELQKLVAQRESEMETTRKLHGKTGIVPWLENVATGWWEFVGYQLPASMLYAFADPSDEEYLEALDDLATGKLTRSQGITRTAEELAERWNYNPEGFSRKLGGAMGGATASLAAVLDPTGMAKAAVLGSFGLMGLGEGYKEYDRIAKENGYTTDMIERSLMGIGYGVAEVGAEYAGISLMKGGGFILSQSWAKELGSEALEKGLKSAVQKWAKNLGVAMLTGAIGEGGEEVLTEIAQNHINVWADPNKDWSISEVTEGSVDAFIMGAVAGGVVIGPGIAIKSRREAGRIAAREGASARNLSAWEQERQRARDATEALDETPVETPIQATEAGDQQVEVWSGTEWQWVDATEENVGLARAQREVMAITGEETPPQSIRNLKTGESVEVTPENVQQLKESLLEDPTDAEVAAVTEASVPKGPSVAIVDAEGNVFDLFPYTEGDVLDQERAENDAEREMNRLANAAVARGEDGSWETKTLGAEETSSILGVGAEKAATLGKAVSLKPTKTAVKEALGEEGGEGGEGGDDAVEAVDDTRGVAAEEVGVSAAEAVEVEPGSQDALNLIEDRLREARGLPARKEGDLPQAQVIPPDREQKSPVLDMFREMAEGSKTRTGAPLKIVQVDTQAAGAEKAAPFSGLYDRGVIYVDAARVEQGEEAWAGDVFLRILGHETVHASRDVNPELYDFLQSRLTDEQVGRYMKEYRDKAGTLAWSQLTTEQQLEEAVAMAFQDIIREIGGGKYTGDRNIVQKLVDWIRTVAARYGLKGEFAQSLESMVQQISEGKSLNEIELAGMGETRAEGRTGPAELMLSPAPPVKSPEFRRWFKDSKAVDEQGNPLVSYHSTSRGFSRFNEDSHFGTAKAANERARDAGGDRVYPVYLSLQNPYRMPDMIDSWEDGSALAKFVGVGDLNYEGWLSQTESGKRAVANSNDRGLSLAEENISDKYGGFESFKDLLRFSGYDSISYVNRNEDVGSVSYIAFDPAQVKSATANVGAFGQRPITEAEATQRGMTVEEAAEAQERGDMMLSPAESRIYERGGDDIPVPLLLKVVRQNPDGFTANLQGQLADSGYIVAPVKRTEMAINKNALDEQALRDYLWSNRDVFQLPGAHLGGWLNKDTGQYLLDASWPLSSKEEAIRVGLWGDQDAIFDLNTLTEIGLRDANRQPAVPEGFPETAEQVLSRKPGNNAEYAAALWGERRGLARQGREQREEKPFAIRLGGPVGARPTGPIPAGQRGGGTRGSDAESDARPARYRLTHFSRGSRSDTGISRSFAGSNVANKNEKQRYAKGEDFADIHFYTSGGRPEHIVRSNSDHVNTVDLSLRVLRLGSPQAVEMINDLQANRTWAVADSNALWLAIRDRAKAEGYDAIERPSTDHVVVMRDIDPSEVTSATPLTPTGEGPMLSPAESAEWPRVAHGLHSQLFDKALAKAPRRKWKPEELINWLRDSKRGVKKDEIIWSNLEEYAEEHKGEMIELDDIIEDLERIEMREYLHGDALLVKLDYFDANVLEQDVPEEVEITNITARLPITAETPLLARDDLGGGYEVHLEPVSGMYKIFRQNEEDGTLEEVYANDLHSTDNLQEDWETAIRADVRKRQGVTATEDMIPGTDWGEESYVLPGGEEYRELKLVLKPKEGFFEYKSHFPERNILLHMRFNTRYDEQGRKIMFLEEVQSDWHQKGRKTGYENAQTRQARAASVKKYRALSKNKLAEIRQISKEYESATGFPIDDTDIAAVLQKGDGPLSLDQKLHLAKQRAMLPKDQKDLWDRYRNAVDEYDEIAFQLKYAESEVESSGVPDIPFKNTWKILAMKRAIAHAVANEFDGIAWTTGEQQRTRSEKQLMDNVSKFQVKPDRFGLKPRTASKYFNLEAWTHDGVSKTYFGHFNELGDYIGGQMSTHVQQRIAAGEKSVTIDAKDFQIGGHGMKAFYDEYTTFTDPKTKKVTRNTGFLWAATHKVGKRFGAEPSHINIDGLGSQPGIMFTDKLKESLVNGDGLPMFSPARPGGESVFRGKSIDEIASDSRVAQGAILQVRDGLTDFTQWRTKMLEKDSNLSEDELADLWSDSILLANYLADDSGPVRSEHGGVGPSGRMIQRRSSREEIQQYAELKRRLRLESKASLAGYRAGVRTGASRERAKATERLERLRLQLEGRAARDIGRVEERAARTQERLEGRIERLTFSKRHIKEFNDAVRQAGMSSRKLDRIMNDAGVRRREFSNAEELADAIDKALAAIEQFHQGEAQNSLRKAMKALKNQRLRPEFDEAAKKVLESVGIGTREVSMPERQRLNAVKKFLVRMKEEGKDDNVFIPESVRARIAEIGDKPISDLTVEESLSIRDAIRLILHQNKLKTKLLKVGRAREFARTRDAIAKEFAQNLTERRSEMVVGAGGKLRRLGAQTPEPGPRLRDIWAKVNILTPDRHVIWTSGSRDTQAYSRLYQDIEDGQVETLRTYQQDKDFLRIHLKEIGIDPDTREGANIIRSMSGSMARRLGRLKSLWHGVRRLSGRHLVASVPLFTRKLPAGVRTYDFNLTAKRKRGRRYLDQGVMTITPAQRISILCHLSDLDTRAAIIAGAELRVDDRHTYTLNEDDVSAIEEFQPEYEFAGEGRDVEREIADVMLERMNGTQRIHMQEYSVAHLGFDNTKDGTYYPRRRYKAGQKDVIEARDLMSTSLDSLGIVRERTGGGDPILLFDAFATYNNHSYMVAGLRHMAAPLRNANRLINSPQMSEMLSTHRGGKGIRNYHNILHNDLVSEISGTRGQISLFSAHHVDEIAKAIARRVTVGALGANIRVMGYQLGSIAAAASEMPTKHALAGTRGALTPGVKEEIEFYSPRLRQRFASDHYGIVSEGLTERHQSTLVKNRTFSDFVMGGIGFFDELAIRSIWAGTKDWVKSDIDKGVLKMEVGSEEYWKEVRSRAEMVVNKTQPTLDLLHMTGLARSARRQGGWSRFITMFATMKHKNINMQAESYMRFRNGDYGMAVKGLIAHTVVQPLVLWGMRGVYALLIGGAFESVRALSKWLGGGDEEDRGDLGSGEEEEDLFHWTSAIDAIIATNFANMPLGDLPGAHVRRAVGAVVGYKPDTYPPDLSPALSKIYDALESAATFSDRLFDGDKELEWKHWWRAAFSWGELSGLPGHYPRLIYKEYKDGPSSTTDIVSARKRYLDLQRREGNITREEQRELDLINSYYNGKYGIRWWQNYAKDNQGDPKRGIEGDPKKVARGNEKADEKAKALHDRIMRRRSINEAVDEGSRGLRVDGTQKGPGWLGTIFMDDGREMTEMSVGVEFDGREVEIPTLVPGLSKNQIEFLRLGGDPRRRKDIMDVAKKHALKRLRAGLSPFKGD